MCKTIRSSLLSGVLTGAGIALAAAPALFGQVIVERKQSLDKQSIEKMMAEVENARTMTFDFVAGEAIGGKTVKNAPYSAEAVTETIQSLADGNRIVNRSSATLYRDSEGRERREQELGNLGSLTADAPVKTVTIWDPVAKASYSLDERRKTARKSPAGVFGITGPGAHISITGMAGGLGFGPDVSMMRTPLPRVGGASGGVTIFESHTETRILDGTAAKSDSRLRTEDLGERMIEGVKTKGTRTTHTIPAGEIGNERPIEITSERWYSDELQAVVMTKRSDPRSGETTYKLLHVNRSEPMKSLFEVPADYTMENSVRIMRSNPGVVIKKEKIEEIF